MNNNSSNTTYRYGMTREEYEAFLIMKDRLYKSYYTLTSLYVVLGTIINVWLIAAILTSPDMRKRLRNQLICMICLCSMLKSNISGPITMSTMLLSEHGHKYNCMWYSFKTYFRLVVEFYDSFLVVALLGVYLAQVTDYDPTLTLNPIVVTLGKIAILVIPCAIGLIYIPTVGSLFKPYKSDCLYVSRHNYLLFKGLDVMVPFVITAVLLVIISVLYYRRFHRGAISSEATRTELIGQGPQIDKVYAYIVAVSINLACQLPSTLAIAMMHTGFFSSFEFMMISWMIIDARTILMPWGWLLLDDIRERIKTWRPWYRSVTSIDLTMKYSRDENDSRN